MVELKNETNVFISESCKFISAKSLQTHMIHFYFPPVCFIQGTEYVQKGAFSRSGGPCYTNNFTFIHLNIDPFEDFYRPVLFEDIFSLKHMRNYENEGVQF